MNQLGTSKHHIGRLIAETGHRRTRIGKWAVMGLLAGGCLGCGYGPLAGFLVGLMSGGIGLATFCAIVGFPVGGLTGLIIGALIGFLIGLAQVPLRRTVIPVPVIAAAVTEVILLPLQVLAAGADGQLGVALFIYVPSALGVGAAATLGLRLSRAVRPLPRRKSVPDLPRSPGNIQPFGATGLRLRAYRPWRYRLTQRRAADAAGQR